MKLNKLGILCAGDTEAAPFLAILAERTMTEKAMLKFYEGTIEGIPVVTLFSGVCKVNAAIAAQILIDSFGCDVIINAGTAGGIDPKLQIFDTVVSTETAYHDVAEDILTDFHPWMPSIYFPADPELMPLARQAAESLKKTQNILFGKMVSGEAFIDDKEKDRILREFSPLSVDMETAAVAHVCYVNRIPFLAVRTITDTADHESGDNFEANCEKASQLSADFVRAMLQKLYAKRSPAG